MTLLALIGLIDPRCEEAITAVAECHAAGIRVNMITAVTLGIALAFEPTEANTMRRLPRPRNEPLLSGSLVWHIVLVAALFLAGVFGIHTYALDRSYPIELARTMSMNTLVVMEIFHLLFIRNMYGTSLTCKAVRGTDCVFGGLTL